MPSLRLSTLPLRVGWDNGPTVQTAGVTLMSRFAAPSMGHLASSFVEIDVSVSR